MTTADGHDQSESELHQCNCDNDDVLESIHITQHDVDRAVDDDKPVYFPSSSQDGVVFAVHAVDSADVHEPDEKYRADGGRPEAEIDPEVCAKCGETTSKFVRECDNCEHDRWSDE